MDNTTNSNAGMGLGIAGLVLGILSIPLGIMKCTFATGLVFGILGITLSAVGLSQARKANAQTGMIIAALIVSIIGTSFAFIKLTSSVTKLKILSDGWKDNIEIIDEQSKEFEKGFEEEFEKEFEENMEETLEDLEDDLNEELEIAGQEIEINLEGMSDEEKARKLGKATGKAVKVFVDELKDTTDLEK